MRHENFAFKIPRLRVTIDLSDEARYFAECDNETNIDAIEQEKRVYERLGKHYGIVSCIQISPEGIRMEYIENGPLDQYIKNHRPVADDMKADWLRSLADTLCYIHGRGVMVYDIALRNILVDDDLSLRYIDFGQSSIIPLESETSESLVHKRSTSSDSSQLTTVSEGRSDDSAVLIDIFHLAFAMYSITVWEKHEHKLFHAPPGLSSDERSQQSLPPNWPTVDDLPNSQNVLCGSILRKCWTREYRSMTQVRDELYLALSPP